jgi:hypothetical protein
MVNVKNYATRAEYVFTAVHSIKEIEAFGSFNHQAAAFTDLDKITIQPNFFLNLPFFCIQKV